MNISTSKSKYRIMLVLTIRVFQPAACKIQLGEGEYWQAKHSKCHWFHNCVVLVNSITRLCVVCYREALVIETLATYRCGFRKAMISHGCVIWGLLRNVRVERSYWGKPLTDSVNDNESAEMMLLWLVIFLGVQIDRSWLKGPGHE